MSIMRTDYLYRIDEKKNVCFVRKKKKFFAPLDPF